MILLHKLEHRSVRMNLQNCFQYKWGSSVCEVIALLLQNIFSVKLYHIKSYRNRYKYAFQIENYFNKGLQKSYTNYLKDSFNKALVTYDCISSISFLSCVIQLVITHSCQKVLYEQIVLHIFHKGPFAFEKGLFASVLSPLLYEVWRAKKSTS